MTTIRTMLFAATCAVPLCAQTVHYPDTAHANPPAVAFPFYTPGVGSTGASVRVQFLCPDSFLAAQVTTPGYVTAIGFSLGGAAMYDEFVLRAGASDVDVLDTDWSVNLPDQRVQLDLSGQVVSGGGTPTVPVNEWVDFPLEFPFHYAPGQSLVVDVTARLADANALCYTTTANGIVQRAYNHAYTPGASATTTNLNGLKLRFTFAPLGMIAYGTGCSSSSGAAPQLSATGQPGIGDVVLLQVDQALPGSLGLLVFGFSRSQFQGTALPLALGGGCELLTALDVLEPVAVPASGPIVWPLVLPLDPALRGTVLFSQFADLDPQSPATLPFVTSNAGVLAVF